MIQHSDSSLRRQYISSKSFNAIVIIVAVMGVVWTSVEAAMGVASTTVGAVFVGAAMDVVAVLEPWWRSNGEGCDDGGGGLEGGPEGVLEPVLRRFLYCIMVVLGSILFLYQDST